jgi:hypothetical protein
MTKSQPTLAHVVSVTKSQPNIVNLTRLNNLAKST